MIAINLIKSYRRINLIELQLITFVEFILIIYISIPYYGIRLPPYQPGLRFYQIDWTHLYYAYFLWVPFLPFQSIIWWCLCTDDCILGTKITLLARFLPFNLRFFNWLRSLGTKSFLVLLCLHFWSKCATFIT